MQNKRPQLGILAAFFGFRRMVSPFFIAVVYFLGLIAIIVITISAILKGPHSTLAKYGFDFESGLLVTACYICIVIACVIALFLWRFICELMTVLFGIHRLLGEVSQMIVEPIEAEMSAQRVQATIAPIVPTAGNKAPTGIEMATNNGAATNDTFVPESEDYEQQVIESLPEETVTQATSKEDVPTKEIATEPQSQSKSLPEQAMTRETNSQPVALEEKKSKPAAETPVTELPTKELEEGKER